MIISAFAALTAMGGATRASIFLGRGDRAGAEKILGNCVTGAVSASLVLTVVFLLFSRPLLMAFGASEETIGYAVQYMRIYALGTVFVELALGLNAFITAQGFASVAMISVLIGAVANMILDAILIPLGMGVAGAALATIISQGLSAAWVVRFLSGKKTVCASGESAV
ncbi:MAG: MATE family efflux transporter [Oscillospiraceae bacterium]